MEKLAGEIPQTVDELMSLIPGIGMYSASAIASVAFQKPVGVVDGNVIRVLSRIRVIGSHVTQPHVRNHLWYSYKKKFILHFKFWYCYVRPENVLSPDGD